MESKKYTMDFAGRPLTLEFGRYCEQANGSVWVHLGDTVVMVNATMAYRRSVFRPIVLLQKVNNNDHNM